MRISAEDVRMKMKDLQGKNVKMKTDMIQHMAKISNTNTNSMAYGTRRFNAAFTRAPQ